MKKINKNIYFFWNRKQKKRFIRIIIPFVIKREIFSPPRKQKTLSSVKFMKSQQRFHQFQIQFPWGNNIRNEFEFDDYKRRTRNETTTNNKCHNLVTPQCKLSPFGPSACSTFCLINSFKMCWYFINHKQKTHQKKKEKLNQMK